MSTKKNWISAALSGEEVETAITGLKSVEAALPFAETLKKKERMSLPKVGLERMDFNKKAYELASRNPDLVPPYIDMAEFKKDLDLSEALDKILYHMVPLTNKLKDTSNLAKVDSYENGRMIYHYAKTMADAGFPGASAVADELGKLYKGQGSSKKSTSTGADDKPDTPTEPITQPQAA